MEIIMQVVRDNDRHGSTADAAINHYIGNAIPYQDEGVFDLIRA